MAASDIPIAREALAALKAGGELTRGQAAALARVERTVGARRPLSSYAPRTQRRYLAAARTGITAHEANKAEYAVTRAREGGLSRRELVMRQARINQAEMGEDIGQFDEDQIDALIEMVTTNGALQLLRGQYRAMRAYKEGNPDVGRARWYDRPDIVERYKSGVGFDEYMVPYFWYRVRK